MEHATDQAKFLKKLLDEGCIDKDKYEVRVVISPRKFTLSSASIYSPTRKLIPNKSAPIWRCVFATWLSTRLHVP